VIHQLETKRMLDVQCVSLVKALILQENQEIMQSVSNYMLNLYDENELAQILTWLTSVLSNQLERPTSAIPKKDPALNYIDSIISDFIDTNDCQIIHRLYKENNEFVLAAFDLFKSDKDQEDLLDTLQRIVKRHKQQENEFVPSSQNMNPSSFYILENADRPATRGIGRESRKFNNPKNHHFSSEDDKLIWGPGLKIHQKFENVIEEQKSLAEFDADKSKSDDYGKSSSETSSSSSSSSSSSDDENQTEAILDMLWHDKGIRTRLDNEARGFLIYGI